MRSEHLQWDFAGKDREILSRWEMEIKDERRRWIWTRRYRKRFYPRKKEIATEQLQWEQERKEDPEETDAPSEYRLLWIPNRGVIPDWEIGGIDS